MKTFPKMLSLIGGGAFGTSLGLLLFAHTINYFDVYLETITLP